MAKPGRYPLNFRILELKERFQAVEFEIKKAEQELSVAQADLDSATRLYQASEARVFAAEGHLDQALSERSGVGIGEVKDLLEYLDAARTMAGRAAQSMEACGQVVVERSAMVRALVSDQNRLKYDLEQAERGKSDWELQQRRERQRELDREVLDSWKTKAETPTESQEGQ